MTSPYLNRPLRDETSARAQIVIIPKLRDTVDDLLEALELLLADYMAINGQYHTSSRVPADKARAAIKQAREG